MAFLTHGWTEKGKYTSRGSVRLFWEEETEENSGGRFFSPLSHRYLNIWEGRHQHVPTSLNTPCWRCVEALIIVHDLLGPMSWMDEREVLII